MSSIETREIRTVVEKAFRNHESLPVLHDRLQSLVDQGSQISVLVQELRILREELRSTANEDFEDFVVDALDMLTGRVSPHLKVRA